LGRVVDLLALGDLESVVGVIAQALAGRPCVLAAGGIGSQNCDILQVVEWANTERDGDGSGAVRGRPLNRVCVSSSDDVGDLGELDHFGLGGSQGGQGRGSDEEGLDEEHVGGSKILKERRVRRNSGRRWSL